MGTHLNLSVMGTYLSYGITVLPVTWHRWMCPAISPGRQAGTQLTYSEGWKAEMTLAVG